jgi:hypothetical protein
MFPFYYNFTQITLYAINFRYLDNLSFLHMNCMLRFLQIVNVFFSFYRHLRKKASDFEMV